jgi:hypothetical protein
VLFSSVFISTSSTAVSVYQFHAPISLLFMLLRNEKDTEAWRKKCKESEITFGNNNSEEQGS